MKITFDIPAAGAGGSVDVPVDVNWVSVPRVGDTVLGVPGQPGTWTVSGVAWVITDAEPIVTLVAQH
ncbi:hypothetical protein GCM10022223_63240 [Kineosporia mesophila]|uniref:Uncharacterized protein n=1 Tax=Kineosporia mesophila TaxID=566012 RepID=A0ABP7AMC8_9ACTN|nr:hypothetical protein [Kineosporia mesophila]MCD5349416.1 hypothetical protein [Kineosporia mesophila]